jgi:hypothetical protein
MIHTLLRVYVSSCVQREVEIAHLVSVFTDHTQPTPRCDGPVVRADARAVSAV